MKEPNVAATPGAGYDPILRRILLPVFVLLFLGNFWVGLKHCLRANSFVTLDWLINYQGGFIKRGLLGEFILHASSATGISLPPAVLIIQSVAFGAFLLFSFLLLRQESRLSPYAFLLFSPFLFMFQIQDEQGAFRKEILYFAILAANVWAARSSRPRLHAQVFYGTLIIYPLVILSHEALALFLPFVVAAYLFRRGARPRRLVAISLLLLVSVGSLAACTLATVGSEQVAAIRDSLGSVGEGDGGAIGWLERDANYGRERVRAAIETQAYVPKYLTCILLAGIAFFPIRGRLKNVFRNRYVLAGTLIAVAGSIPLFLFALDWGRFINVYLVTLFLVSFLPEPQPRAIPRDGPATADARGAAGVLHPRSWGLVGVLLLYSIAWRIPHCCGDPIPTRWVRKAVEGAAGLF